VRAPPQHLLLSDWFSVVSVVVKGTSLIKFDWHVFLITCSMLIARCLAHKLVVLNQTLMMHKYNLLSLRHLRVSNSLTCMVLNWAMRVAIINVSFLKELPSHVSSLIELWLSCSLKFRNNFVVLNACIHLSLSSHNYRTEWTTLWEPRNLKPLSRLLHAISITHSLKRQAQP